MQKFAVLFAVLLGFAVPAQAQNGLYTPAQAAPTEEVGPVLRRLLMARDSVFHLDSIMVRQVAPSPTYDSIWVSVERCAKLPMPDSLRASWTISAAPGDGFIVPGGKDPVPGYTFVETRNIVVLEKYVLNRALLAHEMVHALIWEDRHLVGHNEHGDMPEFAQCGVQNQ